MKIGIRAKKIINEFTKNARQSEFKKPKQLCHNFWKNKDSHRTSIALESKNHGLKLKFKDGDEARSIS